jgi:hypothetical protein
MRAQIDFSRTTEFENFFNGLFNLEVGEIGHFVQGVVIDLHPTWRSYWDLWKRTGFDLEVIGFPFPGYWPLLTPNVEPANGTPDPSWTCHPWERLKQQQGKLAGGPFVVKICTRPFAFPIPEIAIIQRHADKQPFFCVLEERLPVRALATVNGGGRITTGVSNGTLGGFLKDQSSNVYGVTCAHVAMSTTATFDLHDVSGVNLTHSAKIAYSSFGDLHQLSKGQLCNRMHTGIQVPDVALLELNPPHVGSGSIGSVGPVDDILTENDLGSGSPVEIKAASGFHRAYIGGYSVVYNVQFEDGNEYCFDHMFEVVTRSASRFASLIPSALSSKPVSGDSGSWVCATSRKGSGNSGFAGLLCAADGSNAFACFADAVLNWASTSNGLTLTPF